MWLHGQYLENEEYAGYIVSRARCAPQLLSRFKIPPAPPTPDFDEPRQKLAKLREGSYCNGHRCHTSLRRRGNHDQRRVSENEAGAGSVSDCANRCTVSIPGSQGVLGSVQEDGGHARGVSTETGEPSHF